MWCRYLVLLALTVPALFGLPPLLAHDWAAALGYALWFNGSWRRPRCGSAAAGRSPSCCLDLLLGMFIGGLVGRLTIAS